MHAPTSPDFMPDSLQFDLRMFELKGESVDAQWERSKPLRDAKIAELVDAITNGRSPRHPEQERRYRRVRKWYDEWLEETQTPPTHEANRAKLVEFATEMIDLDASDGYPDLWLDDQD